MEAVNNMDISRIPNLTPLEKKILRNADNIDVFEEKFAEPEKDHENVKENAKENAKENVKENAKENAKEKVIESPKPPQKSPPKRQKYIDIESGQVRDTAAPGKNKDRRYFESHVMYEKIRIPIRVPITLNEEEIGDVIFIQLIIVFAD